MNRRRCGHSFNLVKAGDYPVDVAVLVAAFFKPLNVFASAIILGELNGLVDDWNVLKLLELLKNWPHLSHIGDVLIGVGAVLNH